MTDLFVFIEIWFDEDEIWTQLLANEAGHCTSYAHLTRFIWTRANHA